ncbi:NADPH2:quinone reductase [Constrictibacter sp. MBR-5]|jgi:NADPH2:quinone reductase|uniref:NADPH:quinone oxidoreductase family protein n=1 Tax=Constrictibacter sp. MBR-5 TaxID=3156467 RepID=UPI0033987630
MRAVLCRDAGGIDSLKVEEVAAPDMIAGGVRIAVEAAGVSFANLLVIAGRHQNKPPNPFVPGTEIAGIVIEVAEGVGHVQPGDRVCAGLPWGGFAEEAVVDGDNVFRIPAGLGYDAATQFPTIYATAYGALTWRARLQPGEVLLVHGAAGASGLAAVEVGKALGATVIATAGSDEKLAVARAHGAYHCIDYGKTDFRDAVLELTGGLGADVIFDPVGGDVFDKSLRCIAPEGRIIPMGFAGGRIPQVPANLLLVKNIDVIGVYWGYYMAWGKTRASAAKRARVRELYAEMFALFEQGKLAPLTYRSLPLDRFAEALRLVENRSVMGKIVLVPYASEAQP